MKVTVLRPPPLDPEDATPPPGRVLRLQGDQDGFSIDNEPRRPWSAARFLCLHRAGGDAATASGNSSDASSGLMLIVDGRRRPFELSASGLEGSAFAGVGEDVVKHALCWLNQASGLLIDRATFAALRGSPAEPMPAEARIYAAAVQRALVNAATSSKTEASRPTAAAALATAPVTAARTPPERGQTCPHCHHPRTAGKAKCERCGVLFAKLEKAPPPALIATDEDDDESHEDLLRLPTADRRRAERIAAESFLNAESLAATIINLARGHGSALVALAASVITAWLLVVIGLWWLVRPSLWRNLLIATLTTSAYVHAVSSLTTALHAAAHGQPWRHRAAWAAGGRRLLKLLPGRMLSLVPIALGFAAFLVPGFVFSLRSAFLEVVGTVEEDPPMGISWAQISSNLSEGFRLSTGALVALTTLTVIAIGLVPACMVGIAATLELIDVAAWLTPSIAIVPPLVLLIAWVATGLSLWVTVLYLLFQELQKRQGSAMWTSPSGLTGLTKIVLLVDLFLLLVVLMRASRLAA